MRIESFHIQGFKSLGDVKVEGLSDINVFYGLNNVGKSNIFQALGLWQWMLTQQLAKLNMSLQQFEDVFGSLLFQLGSNNLIHLEINTVLNRLDFGKDTERLALKVGSANTIQMTHQIQLKLHRGEVEGGISQVYDTTKTLPFTDAKQAFRTAFHTIHASRRLHPERKEQENSPNQVVSDHNLKRSLFYAYLSRDLEQKRRLEAIKRLLTESPFSLGELDIALDPQNDQIDIGFVRPDGRLPLESLGSGAQQLLLVLGQIFLNDYPIIAVEEPEMNLSPQYQQYLLVALRRLMQDPNVKLNQLFISTHSPYFEFEENFFDVTMDEHNATHVARLPVDKRERYFPDTQVGPDTGARLNSFQQVKLYDGVIQDLELQRGDMVIFTKNKAGHWEIRPEHDIIEELEGIK